MVQPNDGGVVAESKARAKQAAGSESQDYANVGHELQREFESRLFWLAGGVVTLGLAGTRAIDKPQSLWWLVVGVVFVFAGLVIAMVGFRVSANISIKLAESWHEGSNPKYLEAVRLQPLADFCDWSSFALVVVGTGCIGYFYLFNLFHASSGG